MYAFEEMTWEEAVTAADIDPMWLIDGLLSDGTTMILGEPKAGKSFLTAGLIASLTSGQPFVGRAVDEARPYSVGVAWTDDRAYRDYANNIGSALPDEVIPNVNFYRMPIMRTPDMWHSLRKRFSDNGNEVLVIDNMTEALNGSLKDDDVVREFFEGTRLFIDDGIPVVIIYHSTEKWSPDSGGKSRMPLGSTLISASVRWIVFIDRAGDDKTVTLHCRGNAPRERLVIEQGEKSRFTLQSETRADEVAEERRNRDAARMDDFAAMAQHVVDKCQGLGTVQAAEALALAFPKYKSTSYKTFLREKGPIGSLLEKAGTGTSTSWELAAQPG